MAALLPAPPDAHAKPPPPETPAAAAASVPAVAFAEVPASGFAEPPAAPKAAQRGVAAAARRGELESQQQGSGVSAQNRCCGSNRGMSAVRAAACLRGAFFLALPAMMPLVQPSPVCQAEPACPPARPPALPLPWLAAQRLELCTTLAPPRLHLRQRRRPRLPVVQRRELGQAQGALVLPDPAAGQAALPRLLRQRGGGSTRLRQVGNPAGGPPWGMRMRRRLLPPVLVGGGARARQVRWPRITARPARCALL